MKLFTVIIFLINCSYVRAQMNYNTQGHIKQLTNQPWSLIDTLGIATRPTTATDNLPALYQNNFSFHFKADKMLTTLVKEETYNAHWRIGDDNTSLILGDAQDDNPLVFNILKLTPTRLYLERLNSLGTSQMFYMGPAESNKPKLKSFSEKWHQFVDNDNDRWTYHSPMKSPDDKLLFVNPTLHFIDDSLIISRHAPVSEVVKSTWAVDENQTVTFTNSDTTGSFHIEFYNHETIHIRYFEPVENKEVTIKLIYHNEETTNRDIWAEDFGRAIFYEDVLVYNNWTIDTDAPNLSKLPSLSSHIKPTEQLQFKTNRELHSLTNNTQIGTWDLEQNYLVITWNDDTKTSLYVISIKDTQIKTLTLNPKNYSLVGINLKTSDKQFDQGPTNDLVGHWEFKSYELYEIDEEQLDYKTKFVRSLFPKSITSAFEGAKIWLKNDNKYVLTFKGVTYTGSWHISKDKSILRIKEDGGTQISHLKLQCTPQKEVRVEHSELSDGKFYLLGEYVLVKSE